MLRPQSGADSTKRANKRKRARICVDGTLELQTKAEVVCVCTPPGSRAAVNWPQAGEEVIETDRGRE
eukprot:527535-Pleurochrysis_carterae.AAC.1